MPARAEQIPLEQYFEDRDPRSRELFEAVRAMILSLGEAEMRVTRSQVAFRRRRGFAWTWIPAQYLHGRDLAPLVLTIDFEHRNDSSRWKEVVESHPGRFTHHLELRSADQLDDEVLAWLREAREQAE